MNGRIPEDPIAEMALLGTMLLGAQAGHAAAELLTAEDFSRPKHGAVFDAIVAVQPPFDRVEESLVLAEMEKTNYPTVMSDLTEMMEHATSSRAASAVRLAQRIKAVASRRRIIAAALELRQAAESGDIDAALPTIMDRLEVIRTGADSPAGQRDITLTAASTIQLRAVRWLWDGRIALGTLALIAGREGIGKSTFAYQTAADLTRGHLPGAYFGTPKGVIVAATEDSWEHTIGPRLVAAGADLERVYRVDVRTAGGYTGSLSLPRDIEGMRKRILEVDAAMVLLDPLMSRLDASLNSHVDAEVRVALEPLVALADKTGAAVIGLIHLNKSTTSDPLTMIMGSRAFAAVARAVLFVATDPEDTEIRILGQPKNNLGRTDLANLTFTIEGAHVADTDEGPVWSSRIVWQGDTDRSLTDVINAAGESYDTRTAVSEAAEWLRDYLTIHQVAWSQDVKKAAREEGHTEATLKRARERAGAGVLTRGFPKRSYWSAPGLTPDDVEKILNGRDAQSG